ncbi:hypothetical protein F2Q68_00012521 [Brassica cretica]|uniref:Uncharacterized protein n=1 Tax=Brassica cretica TaxID=69181 RepID=A0A8S9KZL3_BRACR|nr:hypothetical protein F2Q68_00012521 [Brassica cretica]
MIKVKEVDLSSELYVLLAFTHPLPPGLGFEDSLGSEILVDLSEDKVLRKVGRFLEQVDLSSELYVLLAFPHPLPPGLGFEDSLGSEILVDLSEDKVLRKAGRFLEQVLEGSLLTHETESCKQGDIP